MTDKKFTDKEIIKALECCSKDDIKDCDICPYNEKETNTYCANDLIKDPLASIIRLKAQNKEFDEKIVMQNGLIECQRDKIAALTEIIEKGDFASYSACRAIEDRKRKNAEYINELKAEIEENNLKIDHQAQIIRTLETALADKMAEIERLKEQPISQDMIKQIQTDILNVFVDKLLGKSYLDLNDGGIYFHRQAIDFDKIIALLKEMTESRGKAE